jgi:hypothetical protein
MSLGPNTSLDPKHHCYFYQKEGGVQPQVMVAHVLCLNVPLNTTLARRRLLCNRKSKLFKCEYLNISFTFRHGG